jgi:hypothetical protein
MMISPVHVRRSIFGEGAVLRPVRESGWNLLQDYLTKTPKA